MVYSLLEIIGYIFNRQEITIQSETIIDIKEDKVIDSYLVEEKSSSKKKKK